MLVCSLHIADGLDITNNMLVLCPNHHALFDYGAVRFVSKDDVEIEGKLHAISMKHELARLDRLS
jgi:predicted restriction endonuclease